MSAVVLAVLEWTGRALGAVPRWAWEALAAAAALFGVWHWHNIQVRAATHAGVIAGMDAQLAADGRAVTRAFAAADAKQDALVSSAAKASTIINQGATDAIAIIDDAAGRALAGFELRHPAPETTAGRAGSHDPAALPGAAGRDVAAAALQQGMVAVPAGAVADAAEVAGHLVVCQNWARDQLAAWPK